MHVRRSRGGRSTAQQLSRPSSEAQTAPEHKPTRIAFSTECAISSPTYGEAAYSVEEHEAELDVQETARPKRTLNHPTVHLHWRPVEVQHDEAHEQRVEARDALHGDRSQKHDVARLAMQKKM